TIEELERVELRRDGHGTDVDVVPDRGVHLVIGRQPTCVAALRQIELLRIEPVVVALDRGRNARTDVELDARRETPRRIVDGVEAALVRTVELETAGRVASQVEVVEVGVDAGVGLSRRLLDRARVVAGERGAEVRQLGEDLVGELLADDDLDALEDALGVRNRVALARTRARVAARVGDRVRRAVAGTERSGGTRVLRTGRAGIHERAR